ncbi:helix-turn-helix domain-containing protein [Paenibacillus sp. NPDC101420]|uniref:helix-turn-helix domain-containing protein n=1 Tax=Paenibacillus sp. NPDC101420 TaxID=3390602 RepID=UPI003D044E85
MDKKIIGAAIKLKRRDKKMRQNELAEKTSLSRNYISDIETGRYMPSVETLAKIATCLGMDLNTLLVSEIQDIISVAD